MIEKHRRGKNNNCFKPLCSIFLLMLVFTMGTISATDFDNTLKYEDRDMTAVIDNWFGLGEELGKVTLTSHKTVEEVRIVMDGEDRIVMYYDSDFNSEQNLGEVIFINEKTGKEIEREYKIVEMIYETKQKEIISYENCKKVLDKNGTIAEKCDMVTNYESYEVLKETKEITKTPNYPTRIGLMMDVYLTDYIDGIWNIAGQEISLHASWTAGLSVGLQAYYDMEDGTGNTATDIFGSYDATTTDMSWDAGGIRDECGNVSATTSQMNTTYSQTGTGAMTINYWFKATATTVAGNEVFCLDGGGWHCDSTPNADGELQMYWGNGGSWQIDYHDGTARRQSDTPGGFVINKWHMITLMINETHITGFLNGTSGTPVVATTFTFNPDSFVFPATYDLYNGELKIDEIMIWNRSLSPAEISGLFDSGTGTFYSAPIPDAPPNVTLNSPANNTNYTVKDVTFNCSATDQYIVENVSLYIDGSLNYTVTDGADNFTELSLTITDFAEGEHYWDCNSYDNATQEGLGGARNFTIDTINPVVNVTYPIGTIDYFENNNNLTINFTATDTNIDSCWYSYDGGTTNTTIVCAYVNISQNITSINNNSIIFYANDSFGNENSITRTWDYRLFFINQTYLASTLEGSTNTFTSNFETNGSSINIAYLNYNNTNYTGSISTSGNIYTLTRSIVAPLISATTNVSFNWILVMDGYQKDKDSLNQTIKEVEIVSNCTDRYVIYNLTMEDEQLKTKINQTLYNTSIKFDMTLYDISRTSIIQTYSNNSLRINPTTICIDNNLSGGEQFVMDIQIKYNAINYSEEMYYIENYILTSSTLNQNLTLYDLKSADAQKFKLIARNPSYIPYQNILIQIDRQYIDEGIFNTTEIPKTDEQGITSASLEVDDVLYNIYLIQDGITIKSFLNTRAICQTPAISTCELDLNALAEAITIPDYETGDDFNFTIGYNSTSKIITSQFVIPSGEPSTVLLQITKEDSLGTSVCTDTINSASGILSCTVPGSFGNSTVIAKIFKDGVEQGKGTISLEQSPSEIFGVVLIILSIIVLLTLIGIGVTDNPVVSAIMLFVGVIVIFSLNLVENTGFIGKGASILFLAIAIILVIIKAGRRT